MADKDEDIKRKAELLGVDKDKKAQSLLEKLDAEFPEIAAMSEEEEASERKRFVTLSKELDTLLKLEKQRLEVVALNPNASDDEFVINPEIAEQINSIQSKLVSIIRGPGEEEVEQLLRESPERIELAEGISLTEQEVFDLMANPNELAGAVENLNELGNAEAADRLSELVAFNLQQDVLSNVIQVPPQTAPQAAVPPLEDPNLVGSAVSPVENIKNNIRNFNRAGAVGTAAEQVRGISSSLKRVRAEERSVTGSLG